MNRDKERKRAEIELPSALNHRRSRSMSICQCCAALLKGHLTWWLCCSIIPHSKQFTGCLRVSRMPEWCCRVKRWRWADMAAHASPLLNNLSKYEALRACIQAHIYSCPNKSEWKFLISVILKSFFSSLPSVAITDWVLQSRFDSY